MTSQLQSAAGAEPDDPSCPSAEEQQWAIDEDIPAARAEAVLHSLFPPGDCEAVSPLALTPQRKDNSLVLVADDDPDQHRLCGAYFPRIGLTLVHAYLIPQCLAMVRATWPAVVILHARQRGPFTPGVIDDLEQIGFEVARRLVVLTIDETLCRLPAVRERVADCIVKPFSLIELGARIRTLAEAS